MTETDRKIGTTEPVANHGATNSIVNRSAYEKKKTLAEGLLDIGLLIANASQLKTIISAGDAYKYFWPMVIMLGLSIVLQLGVGVILILLGFAEGDIQKDEQSKKMNNVTVGLILAVLVLNVFIGAFGIELT